MILAFQHPIGKSYNDDEKFSHVGNLRSWDPDLTNPWPPVINQIELRIRNTPILYSLKSYIIHMNGINYELSLIDLRHLETKLSNLIEIHDFWLSFQFYIFSQKLNQELKLISLNSFICHLYTDILFMSATNLDLEIQWNQVVAFLGCSRRESDMNKINQ